MVESIEAAGNEPLACIHHWKIEPPNGQKSLGKCDNCAITREFDNFDRSTRSSNDRFFGGPRSFSISRAELLG